jgi:hypothetical protein
MSKDTKELNGNLIVNLGKMMALAHMIKEKIADMDAPISEAYKNEDYSNAEQIKEIFHASFSWIREYTDRAFEILKESK